MKSSRASFAAMSAVRDNSEVETELSFGVRRSGYIRGTISCRVGVKLARGGAASWDQQRMPEILVRGCVTLR